MRNTVNCSPHLRRLDAETLPVTVKCDCVTAARRM